MHYPFYRNEGLEAQISENKGIVTTIKNTYILTGQDKKFLECLIINNGYADYSKLIKHVYGIKPCQGINLKKSLEVQANHLRESLDEANGNPIVLNSVYGFSAYYLSGFADPNPININNDILDTYTKQIKLEKSIIKLSPKEYYVLHKLAINQGNIVEHSELIQEPDLYSKIDLKEIIYQLRKKIGHNYIRNKKYKGYFIPKQINTPNK